MSPRAEKKRELEAYVRGALASRVQAKKREQEAFDAYNASLSSATTTAAERMSRRREWEHAVSEADSWANVVANFAAELFPSIGSKKGTP